MDDIDSNNTKPVIEITDMTKVYVMGTTEVHALRDVSLTIHAGRVCGDHRRQRLRQEHADEHDRPARSPHAGSYRIRGTESSQLSKDRMADLRNQEIGFVFQRFNLLARTTRATPGGTPALLCRCPVAPKPPHMATEALGRVGLGDRTHHRPDELSGGQQQRVAIARALVITRALLLADEPTGALDSKTGQEMLALFDDLHEQGITLIVVTHDMGVASRAERVITLLTARLSRIVPTCCRRRTLSMRTAAIKASPKVRPGRRRSATACQAS